MTTEEATKEVSIRPFIRALGYDTANLSEVRPEFPILNMYAVDFALMRDNRPIIFIEAKRVDQSLDKHWKQLFQYFNADDVIVGILTNGILYRFYTDLKKSHIMDMEPFLTVDMLNLDKRLVTELDSFTKANFDPQRILDGAQKRRIARLLAREIEEPSDDFVRYFAKQVHSGRLTGEDVQRYRQLVGEAWRELASAPPKPPPPPPPPPNGPKYIPIYGYYEGQRFEAELLRTSIEYGLTIAGHQVRYNGETTWLKDAAVKAIRSVDPSFEPTKTYPNGFKFWHVADPDGGKEHMIRSISGWDNITDEALRERILST